jgi:hypothetical protein
LAWFGQFTVELICQDGAGWFVGLIGFAPFEFSKGKHTWKYWTMTNPHLSQQMEISFVLHI